jgi:hypothetical protein
MSARVLLAGWMIALVCTAPSLAQQPQSDQATADRASQGGSDARATKGSNTSPPVVVTGRAGKPCAVNDQQCVHDVSLELWRKYPKEIDALCGLETMHAMETGFLQEQLGYTMTPGDGSGPVGLSNHITPQTQALCQFRTTHANEFAEPATAEAPAR